MKRPEWDRLYEVAAAQQGLFTTKQASEAGYSPQLLIHHVGAGNVMRVRRGVYRLVHFPAGDQEDLVAAWLWSDREAIVSHDTALSLHGLSDALPARIHLTLPAYQTRRFRVPDGVVLHHANVPKKDRTWFGSVPTTNARRTLSDIAKANLSPELVRAATRQAISRGLVTRASMRDVEKSLKSFGGRTSASQSGKR